MPTSVIKLQARAVVLDIEGTTSSIHFVTDTMFPYVREHLAEFLHSHGSQGDVVEVATLIQSEAKEAGWQDDHQETSPEHANLISAVHFLMDRDSKTTGLKKLQGMIWKDGFESHQMVAHVYNEVPECLNAWKSQGLDLRIYSSGSIAAQKLFFGHTTAGNLLSLFSHHYDTTTGMKREVGSYQAIVSDIGIPASDVVFVSDVVEELDAASAAGLQCVLSVRPGNPPQRADHNFPAIESFKQIELL
ncbi:MAG: acireductone synthase [Pirellulaceae bacterium]